MEHPRIIDIRDTCTGCGACADSCKKGCITMAQDEHGFYYPQIDLKRCVMCGVCGSSCHVLAASNQYDTPQWWGRSSVYVYQSRSKDILENSTSGGAFTLFASKVLDAGGVVFASRYNGDLERLEFSDTDNHELCVFRKSRYMESYTNGGFGRIKDYLMEGRSVLFCGTPCQVAGLNEFLGKIDRRNLLTLNFICHGVPSNRHFHEWLHSKFPSIQQIDNVDFRYKNKNEGWGWHQMCLSIKEKSGRRTSIPYTDSSYYLSFFHNDLLRKSCYSCRIINKQVADITLGDFWGVNNKQSIDDDNSGLSLVILHSEKAQSLLPVLETEGSLCHLDYQDIEYAFHPRVYSLENRVKMEEGIKRFGYVDYLDRKYKITILKYKMEKIIPIQKIYKWLNK